MKRAVTAVAVIITALVGLSPRRAEACSCGVAAPLIVPSDGATDLPTNVVFFVETPLSSPYGFVAKLVGPSGEIWVRKDLIAPQVAQLVPLDPLIAGESYTLEVTSESGQVATSSVTIANVTDNEKPVPPGLKQWTHSEVFRSEAMCGDAESYVFDVTDRDEAVGIRFFTGPSLEQVNFDTPSVMNFERQPALRNALCATNFLLRDTPDLAIAIQSVDAAGNVSEISAPKQIRTAGCSSVAAPPMVLLLIAVLRPKRNGPRGK